MPVYPNVIIELKNSDQFIHLMSGLYGTFSIEKSLQIAKS